MSESTSRQRVLICEDEGMTVLMLRQALNIAGYEVVGEAANGNKAVDLALALKPDFILMDINMPGIDGIEASRRIHEHYSVPIIMLTAYSEDALVQEAIDSGACAYLVKPIVSQQLPPVIKTALARFEAQEHIRQENASLKDALETRKLVERAKGILMERIHLTEADALRRLQKTSRDKCQTMKQTASEIIQADSVFKQA